MTKTFSSNTTIPVGITAGCEFSVAVPSGIEGTLSVRWLQNGSEKQFASGDTGQFVAADERVFVNCGDADEIHLVLSGQSTFPFSVTFTNLR